MSRRHSVAVLEVSWGVVALMGVAQLAFAACSTSVKYAYRGTEYTMTASNVEYHKCVLAEVRRRFGVVPGEIQVQTLDRKSSPEEVAARLPALGAQSESLDYACVWMKGQTGAAPDGGGLTPARDLLAADTQSVCAASEQSKSEVALGERYLSQVEDQKKRAQQKDARAALEETVFQCEARAETVSCEVEGATPAQKRDCEARCKARSDVAFTSAVLGGVPACLGAYFDGNGKKTPSCDLKFPYPNALAPGKISAANSACVEMCSHRIQENRAAAATTLAELRAASGSPPARGEPIEERIKCLERRCDACTTDQAIQRWGSPEACLPAFRRCAEACGCTHLGGDVTSLADACR
jgi:hypothetical protein